MRRNIRQPQVPRRESFSIRTGEDRERRKQDLIRVYEQLVEGRPEIVHKLVEDFVEPTNYVAAQQRLEPIINFDKLINSLSTVEALYKEHQEMDDEDVLLLL